MRKISVALRCQGVQDDSATHTVILSRVPTAQEGAERHEHLELVPVHPQTDDPPPTTADCHLQIWELDYFHTNRFLAGEETDSSDRRNQRIASFPGVVMIEGRRAVFHPIGDPDLVRDTVDHDLGKVNIGLIPMGETVQRAYGIPLPEFETIFELGAAIRTSATDERFGEERDISPHKVRNVVASLRHQVAERGGITVSFVADYRESNGRLRPSETPFTAQGEECLGTLPSFVGSGEDFSINCHLTNDWHTMASHIDAARSAAGSILGVSPGPKVATILIYSHGTPRGLKLVYSGEGNGRADFRAANSLRDRDVRRFVQAIRPHITNDIVLTLFACSAGRGYSSGSVGRMDTMHGRPYPCEHVGADSLGWMFKQEFQRRGIARPTVWAHATAGHAAHNSWLRVFSHLGTAELINFVANNPRVAAGAMSDFKMNFAYLHQPEATYRTRLSNANFIRSISLARAVDLPWSAVGNPDPPATSPGYHAEPKREADHVLSELRGIAGTIATEQEEVEYSQGGAFIIGARTGVSNPHLSADFRLDDLLGLDDGLKPDPFRIKVELMRAVQLLRNRARRPVGVARITEDGSGIVITGRNAAQRTTHRNKAAELVEQGFLTASGMVGEEIHLSHNGVIYSDDFGYIVGKSDDERFGDPLLTNSPSPIRFSEIEELVLLARVNRLLVLHVRELGLHPDVNQQLTIENLGDNEDSLIVRTSRVAEVVAAAQTMIEEGRLRFVEGLPAEDQVLLSMVDR